MDMDGGVMGIPSNAVQVNGVGVLTDDELNTLVQVDQTAAQLRGFTGVTGMAVIMMGATAVNDGQGGIYYWQTGTAFIDNGTTVIVPPGASGQGAWLRLTIAGGGGGGPFLALAGGTVTGLVIFQNGITLQSLPTSDAGLTSGQVWNNTGFLCIVP